MATVNAVSAALQAAFDKSKWNYDFNEETHLLRTSFDLDCKLAETRLRADVCSAENTNDGEAECTYIMVLANVGVKADPDCMLQVAEYFTRANFGLRNGNFELDFHDGEIRYKTFIDCHDLIPSEEVLRKAIIIPVSMFDRYGNGLLSVIMGIKTPEEAIEEAESDD